MTPLLHVHHTTQTDRLGVVLQKLRVVLGFAHCVEVLAALLQHTGQFARMLLGDVERSLPIVQPQQHANRFGGIAGAVLQNHFGLVAAVEHDGILGVARGARRLRGDLLGVLERWRVLKGFLEAVQ